jgi:DNA replication initiation complex subunit (GINS family)
MPQEVIITYETLYEILRKEKYRQELQKLPDSFLYDVVKYVTEKTAILESQKSKDSVFARKEIDATQKQLQNLKRLIKEIYERRETKILQLAVYSSRSDLKAKEIENMLPEELKFYECLKDNLNHFRNGILTSMIEGKIPEVDEPKELKTQKKQENLLKRIRFIYPVPTFTGTDQEIYGPFEREDIGNIPIKIANLLIKKQRAELL